MNFLEAIIVIRREIQINNSALLAVQADLRACKAAYKKTGGHPYYKALFYKAKARVDELLIQRAAIERRARMLSDRYKARNKRSRS